MNISTSMMQHLGTTAILDQQSKLNKAQLQVATGNRMLSAADDPAAAAQVIDLKSVLSVNTQYKSTMDTLKSKLQSEEASLTNIDNVLQRARELTVQGMNDGALSDRERQNIGLEITQLKDQLLGLSNSKHANGEYIFSGTLTGAAPYPNAAPYTYQGDANQRKLQIGNQFRMVDGDPGSQVFGGMPSGAASVMDSLETLATALSTPGSLGAAGATGLKDIDAALTQTLKVQAGVGGRLSSLDMQATVNSKFILDTQENISNVSDVDITEAISRLTSQQVALQAAQQSYTKVQNLSLFNYLR